jgi:Xaa-Pro dipeptidase
MTDSGAPSFAGKELIFDRAEYLSRVESVRRKMEGDGLDVMLVHGFENVFYLTGQKTTGIANYQCLIVPARGSPLLVLRKLELNLARTSSWLSDFVSWEDHEDPVEVTISAMRQLGAAKGRIGLEEGSLYLSARSAATFKRACSEADFVDATGLVEEFRRVKSPRELEYIREAARITSVGMRAAVEEAAEGKTENDVAAASVAAMYRAGGEFMAREPTVNSGWRAGIAHTTFRRRRLEKGDSVLIEQSGSYNHYAAPLFRTISIGEPSDELKRMSDACIEALYAGIDAIKPGCTGGDVELAFRQAFEKYGYSVGKRAGYSVGIGFPPSWMETSILALKRDDDTPLVPGMALHIPSALRDAGVKGAGCSETLLVTDAGCDIVTDFERRLFVK